MALFGRPTEKDDAREAAYRQWFARQHPLALASLLLSLFSLTHFGTLIVDEAVGIAFGVAVLLQTGWAVSRFRRSPRWVIGRRGRSGTRVGGHRRGDAKLVLCDGGLLRPEAAALGRRSDRVRTPAGARVYAGALPLPAVPRPVRVRGPFAHPLVRADGRGGRRAAVEPRELLIVFPFSAWFFPSRVVAGRPIPPRATSRSAGGALRRR